MGGPVTVSGPVNCPGVCPGCGNGGGGGGCTCAKTSNVCSVWPCAWVITYKGTGYAVFQNGVDSWIGSNNASIVWSLSVRPDFLLSFVAIAHVLGGAVKYTIPVRDWKCCDKNVLNKESGPADAPAAITVEPLDCSCGSGGGGGGGGGCIGCGSVFPAKVAVTLAGVVQGGPGAICSDCSKYNQKWILSYSPRLSVFYGCTWAADLGFKCFPQPELGNDVIYWTYNGGGGGMFPLVNQPWVLGIYSGVHFGGPVLLENTALWGAANGGAGYDCLKPATLSYLGSFGYCKGWPLNPTVEPA